MPLETYHADDELEKLKTWWKNYGSALVAGVVLGACLLVGFNYWKQHKEVRAASASQLYEKLFDAIRIHNMPEVERIGEQLRKDYDATPYAGKAALILAKFRYDAADKDGARSHLEWAMDNATEAATQHAARLRLARLLIDQGELEAALKLAKVKKTEGFESAYQELRGDILVALGSKSEARAAYQAAVQATSANEPYIRVLNMKLDDLGPEESP